MNQRHDFIPSTADCIGGPHKYCDRSREKDPYACGFCNTPGCAYYKDFHTLNTAFVEFHQNSGGTLSGLEGTAPPVNDIQRRIQLLIDDIENGRTNWNEIVLAILHTDLKFSEFEIHTLQRDIYFFLCQLLDLLNIERNGLYYKIPYEYADMLSMSIGFMAAYGDPAKFMQHRVAVNRDTKGEENIAKKYEERWQNIGKQSIKGLLRLLKLHDRYDYFHEEEKK